MDNAPRVRSPPNVEVGCSNEDATCRLGLRGAAAQRARPLGQAVSTSPLRLGRIDCSVWPKRVRLRPKSLYECDRFACTTSADAAVRFHPFCAVKTLDSSAGYEPYVATRAFWERHGFVQVDAVDPLRGWPPGNPAAIYLCALGPALARATR
jgi:hypothetical protein